ncbi:hypothetical protein HZF08_37935 [Paenibacillus sp. CGMCC 1.16610]|uniref:Secreted protein n=1 Tax=Paenibacillus anseongense TaxID=2682845 RepID=A0ABW9UER0_9BACL|nr:MULTISPECIES: hypothetical protein [Paenibacillus]MBA2944057.1 hypothetical protein [Paenibacillus sp. CGMCC 1.16610]MVQ37946.1 hypothetical protein [Paenibacillus anseongense]
MKKTVQVLFPALSFLVFGEDSAKRARKLRFANLGLAVRLNLTAKPFSGAECEACIQRRELHGAISSKCALLRAEGNWGLLFLHVWLKTSQM